MKMQILKILIIFAFILPLYSQDFQEDDNLKELKGKYIFEKSKVTELYKKYGYSFYKIEKEYGREVFEIIKNMGEKAFVILSKKPEPFDKLKESFSLYDAVFLTYLLIIHNDEEKLMFSEIEDCLNKDKMESFYTENSDFEFILQKYYLKTSIAMIWSNKKRDAILSKLLNLNRLQVENIKYCPPALPYFLVIDKEGLKTIESQGVDFLYFISLINANQWKNFSKNLRIEGKSLLESINIYNWLFYFKWLENPQLVEKLVNILGNIEKSLNSFQKAMLFFNTNKDIISRYKDYSNFLEKTKDILNYAKKVNICENYTLLDRILVDKWIFKLLYEYPSISKTAIEKTAKYQKSIAEILYKGNLSHQIPFILETINNNPKYTEMLFRGINKYDNSEQFKKIINDYGVKGMMVAISLSPNDFWKELRNEGENFLKNYTVLNDGGIKEINTKEFFELPLIDAFNLGRRLIKGYYVDSSHWVKAGIDVTILALEIAEVYFSGQKGASEIAKGVLKNYAIDTGKKFLIEVGVNKIDKQFQKPIIGYEGKKIIDISLGLVEFVYKINKNNDKDFLSKEKLAKISIKLAQIALDELKDSINGNSINKALLEEKIEEIIKIEISELSLISRQKELKSKIIKNLIKENKIFPKKIPEKIYNYSFNKYRNDIKNNTISKEIIHLTEYMMENIIINN